jgi:hypothetical protein
MLAAMGRVKALQAADLRRCLPIPPSQLNSTQPLTFLYHSISAIASSDLPTLTAAITDEKAAKSLLTACKAHLKSPSAPKRAASSTDDSPSSKRLKSAYSLPGEPQSPAELEASLALPQPSQGEEAISKTTIYTNRAPLVLTFAVQLLKYTMPEQPLSGRLSLAQAVVSVNSRSKAVSLGLEKGSAEKEGWGMGQPKVRVMGREVSVLKRSGYEWREAKKESDVKKEEEHVEAEASTARTLSGSASQDGGGDTTGWTISSPITSKKSTFIARAITVKSPTEATSLVQKLLSANPDLRSADHNITAFRTQGSHNNILESSEDDGESGGGRHILGLLQQSNLTNVLLVVTRWYGGIMLGPDRWRIMSEVSRDALSQRLRVAGVIGHEALWGLDLEGMKSSDAPVIGGTAVGMPIHRPEGARNYILKSFASPPAKDDGEGKKAKKKTAKEVEREKEENLGLLLGALDMLFGSWSGHIGKEELDRRAWGWYVQVRPEVESGVAGWGGKGEVKLQDILNLRRKE